MFLHISSWLLWLILVIHGWMVKTQSTSLLETTPSVTFSTPAFLVSTIYTLLLDYLPNSQLGFLWQSSLYFLILSQRRMLWAKERFWTSTFEHFQFLSIKRKSLSLLSHITVDFIFVVVLIVIVFSVLFVIVVGCLGFQFWGSTRKSWLWWMWGYTSPLTAATGRKLDYHSSHSILIIPPTDQVHVWSAENTN